MDGLRFPRRLTAILVLATILASPVLGAEPRPRAEVKKTGFVTALATELRIQLWSLLSRLWPKEGCSIDPHGVCTTDVGAATVTGEEGCGLDPHGVCTTNPTPTAADEADVGCGIDPHGSCEPGH